MKKFKEYNAGTQLFVGFGLLIFVILGLSLVAWQQTQQLALQTENLYNHPLIVRRALGKFETAVTAMNRDIRGLLILGNHGKEAGNLLAELEVNRTEALRQLVILEDRYLGPPSDITALRNSFIKWNSFEEEIIRLLLDGKGNAASERFMDEMISSSLSQGLFEKTFVVDDFARRKGDSFYNESVQLRRDLNLQLLIITLIGLSVSVASSGYLIRLIKRPIKEITRAIESYHSGNRNARSKYSSPNQFGLLSHRLNEMVESIENENLIANQLASISAIMLREERAEVFCQDVLKSLLQHTNSQMGAVYLLNDDKSRFVCFASIGVRQDECLSFSAITPEGEIGLAMVSGEISLVKDIPEDCGFRFYSVTGSIKPREIITIPVIKGNRVVSVFSIFSIFRYSGNSIQLIRKISDSLAARMIGVHANNQVIEFSRQLEEQNHELNAQKKELTAMANELKEQNFELEAQKQQLGEISRLKTNFLSNMSHELRTPLNSVIALSGVLSRRLVEKVDKEEYGYLAVIERNGKHLLDLINDILDLSRIEAGKTDLEKNRFQINHLISEVVAMVKPQADSKNIAMVLSSGPGEISIENDYKKCFHIFQNIIGNAVKFTEKGRVQIHIADQGDRVVVRVEDTGIGIAKADLPYIFDEFRQVDGSNSRKFGGTGLGLAIVKKYADLIGCELGVESKYGIGSVFTVMIPKSAMFNENAVISIAPDILEQLSPIPQEPNGQGKTILLVEDTEAMIVQVSYILRAEGYSIETANNGFQALHFLETRIPDAIILDLMMPGMDGFELLNVIRNQTKTAHVPVLVLTAKILSDEELKAIKNNHVHQLIQKGKITEDSLLEAIALLMHRKTESHNLLGVEIIPKAVSGKPVVLAVEDNADNMLALNALIGESCEFLEAVNGIEALQVAKKQRPDIILMDIAMPGMNGFETLSQIRKDDSLKHIPVIVVTSSAMRGDRTYFLEFGFNGYVSKPVDREVLLEEMDKWLKMEN